VVLKGNNISETFLGVSEGHMSPPKTPKTTFHKIALLETERRQRAKSSITQPRIVRFRSNLVQSLNTWHPTDLLQTFKVKCERSAWQRQL